MVQISDLIIHHPEITSFEQLEELVKESARRGEIHLIFDLKPEYADTPRRWQDRLEIAFTSILGTNR
ncbi:MAG: sulfur relay protein DsrC [Rhodomicrobium sp.]|nr:sulfur relay protein DsrC [Rhodomicrobium sp.]